MDYLENKITSKLESWKKKKMEDFTIFFQITHSNSKKLKLI